MGRAKFKLKMNDQGLQNALKSDGVKNELEKLANNMKNDAKRNSSDPDAEYKVTTYVGRDRARARVRTNNVAAAREEAKNRTLSRSIGRAKG